MAGFFPDQQNASQASPTKEKVRRPLATLSTL